MRSKGWPFFFFFHLLQLGRNRVIEKKRMEWAHPLSKKKRRVSVVIGRFPVLLPIRFGFFFFGWRWGCVSSPDHQGVSWSTVFSFFTDCFWVGAHWSRWVGSLDIFTFFFLIFTLFHVRVVEGRGRRWEKRCARWLYGDVDGSDFDADPPDWAHKHLHTRSITFRLHSHFFFFFFYNPP